MNKEEKIAKILMERIHIRAEMQYRPDQSNGEYDFDMRYPDGTTAAVEVTTSTDQKMKEMMKAISKKDIFIRRRKGINDWIVSPTTGASINKILSKVDEYVAEIESEGLTEFLVYTNWESPSVVAIYNDLKIERGKMTQWTNSPCIVVDCPVQGNGLVLAEDIQQAIEAVANKKDNKRKLGTAGTDERHLFVYIDLDSLAWDALVRGVVPEQPPSLPFEITHVGAVTHTRSVDEFTVWRAERSQGWQNLGTISVNPS
jgi:hypothetical protein